MVFSALLSASSDRASRAKSITSPSTASLASNSSSSRDGPTEYISNESQLRAVEPEHPDLRELNNCLDALAIVFPDVQIEVFREMLSSFDGESRLALVADALLKGRASWVKGRWRVAATTKDGAEGARPDKAPVKTEAVPRTEVFRSPEYKKAVKSLALAEFKGLSRSTISAILAESNYSYLDARRALVDLSSKSWRFTISSIFLRRKPVASSEAETHPLVVWKSSGQGSITPSIKATGNAELDKELFEALVVPLNQRSRLLREESDHVLALALNTEEAEETDSTHECACCFTSATFEEITACSTEGHLVCFRCVQHTITEAVFGQGWQRSINKQTGTLRCPAVSSSECQGCIPAHQMHRAMLEEKKGAEIMHKLDQRLAENSLVASKVPLVRCPFCTYAEVDEIYLPLEEMQWRLIPNNVYNLLFLVLCVGIIPFLLPIVFLSSFLALLLSSKHTFGDYMMTELKEAVTRARRRRRGPRFSCQNPECRRVSCLSCSKEWVDVHVCHESALISLRTQVEQAMSMAIKRVCPRCNTSFVKTAGCNKLTCPCGYKMCYVCRKDIGDSNPESPDAGYQHFCNHFRPDGNPQGCTQCNKCNLWEAENTELVLRQAKEEAEQKWLETERRELSGPEKAYLETGIGMQPLDRRPKSGFIRPHIPTVVEVCDFIVENIIVCN